MPKLPVTEDLQPSIMLRLDCGRDISGQFRAADPSKSESLARLTSLILRVKLVGQAGKGQQENMALLSDA